MFYRQNHHSPSLFSALLHRHFSSPTAASSSKLRDYYNFTPPDSLSPDSQSPNPNFKKKEKPRYKPPSSLEGVKTVRSNLPFDFRYSYTESSPYVRPIGLREPKYSPFGPGRLDREWTGVCAPAVDPKVRSVDGVEDPKLEEKRKAMRERVQGAPLTEAERKVLVEQCQKNKTKRQINLGRDGLTHNMLNDIFNHWKLAEAVRIKCLGVSTVDMNNVTFQLEDKTFGKVIHRHCGTLVLYRGRNYNPKKRPTVPLMLWRPHEPVYPRLIKTTIEGLSIEETKEMRKKGLAVPVLTKLAKNGYYGSLVPMVRDAFIVSELVRIDCQGLERSDYKKIGCKLRDMVPCIPVTFDKEQIVIWRGKDYKPPNSREFFVDRKQYDSVTTSSTINPESTVLQKVLNEGDLLQSSLIKLHMEDSSQKLNSIRSNHFLLDAKPDSVQLHQKTGKLSRNNCGPSKRAKFALSEGTTNVAAVNNTKGVSDKQGSLHRKSNSPDKNQTAKHKSNPNGKRGEKRNYRVPMRSMAGFNSVAGENNFLGIYGLKRDVNDVTKLLGDISLDELLDGTYDCPTFQEKGKKVETTNENFLHSVEKVSVAVVSSADHVDDGDLCAADRSSCDKDDDNNGETSLNLHDFQPGLPKEILERLALPPPRDLDSLLQAGLKHPQLSRSSSDQRSGKHISRGVSLPPFSWSNSFNGYCRSNSDGAKPLPSKGTCHGRWARIGQNKSSPGCASGFSTNLEWITFDHNLLSGLDLGMLKKENLTSVSNLLLVECSSPSVPTLAKFSHISTGSHVEVEDVENTAAAHSPELLACAKILHEMANQSPNHNPNGILRWPKRPSQKAMKARKLKSIEKPLDIGAAAPTSVLGLDNQARQPGASKKPKHLINENKRDLSCAGPIKNGIHKVRSSKASPSKSERKHSSTNSIKLSCMMPPPARVVDKACCSQPKVRKSIPVDWDRIRDKKE